MYTNDRSRVEAEETWRGVEARCRRPRRRAAAPLITVAGVWHGAKCQGRRSAAPGARRRGSGAWVGHRRHHGVGAAAVPWAQQRFIWGGQVAPVVSQSAKNSGTMSGTPPLPSFPATAGPSGEACFCRFLFLQRTRDYKGDIRRSIAKYNITEIARASTLDSHTHTTHNERTSASGERS